MYPSCLSGGGVNAARRGVAPARVVVPAVSTKSPPTIVSTAGNSLAVGHIYIYSSCIPTQVKHAGDNSTLGQLCPLSPQRTCPPSAVSTAGELTVGCTSICCRRVFARTKYGQLCPLSSQRTAPPARCLNSGELIDGQTSVCLLSGNRQNQMWAVVPDVSTPDLLLPAVSTTGRSMMVENQ